MGMVGTPFRKFGKKWRKHLSRCEKMSLMFIHNGGSVKEAGEFGLSLIFIRSKVFKWFPWDSYDKWLHKLFYELQFVDKEKKRK